MITITVKRWLLLQLKDDYYYMIIKLVCKSVAINIWYPVKVLELTMI